MKAQVIKVLLVEDNPGDVWLIREMLQEAGEGIFALEWVPRLSEGLERLGRDEIDVILLDLGLPDSQGLDSFVRVYARAPQVPIVVLSSQTDESLVISAVRQGAQDYLIKGQVDGGMLLRAIRYATERKRAERALMDAHDTLEQRVDERTAELQEAIGQLLREIARRQRAEKALQESEARYRAIFDSTGTATTIVDSDMTLFLVNSEFEKLSGYSKEEIEGTKKWTEFVADEDQLREMMQFHRERRQEPSSAPCNYEFKFKNRWGELRDILITMALIPGTEKSIGSLLDITARKEAEAALQLAHDNLELKVALRTAELVKTNEELRREIEERRAAEQAVEAERQRLYDLLDGIPATVYVKAPDLSIRFANRHFRERFSPWEGRYCYEALRGRKEPCESCPTIAVFETGRPNESELTNQRTNRSFQTYHYPLADIDGSPLVLTLAIDITQRKQAEEALEAERQRLFSLLDGLPSFVYLKAPDYSIRFANRAFRKIFGATQGKRCFEVVHGRTEPCNNCPSFEVLTSKQPQEWEWNQVITGRAYQVYNYPFVDIDGSPLVLTLGMDISERKQAEEALRESEAKYRLLVSQVPAVVFKGYADWSIDCVGGMIENLTGYPKEEFDSRRLLWRDLIPEEDLDYAKRVFLEALGRTKSYVREHRIRRKDGELRWVQCRGQIFCDAVGKVDYISGVTFDVTERRRVEEALKESEKNLRHLAIRLITAQEDERKRLSRELHDELGQSLLVLRLQIGSLEKKLRGEAQVTRADSAAILSYLDGVIDNVRRLSRDLSPYILEDLGLSSALRYLISEFDRHYSIQRCVVDLDEIDHLFFQEAQVNIYRIFQESLTNIGKYAHATQVFIAVKRQGDQVSFVVEDNGLGFNVSQVLTVGGGKGLGLAAMEERVRMLGGTLKIKSREGAGTRISFTLPIEVRAGARFAGQ